MARILTLEAASAQRRGGWYDTERNSLVEVEGDRWELANLTAGEISDQLAQLAAAIVQKETNGSDARQVQMVSVALSAPIDHDGKAILSQGPAVIEGDMASALTQSMQQYFPNLSEVVVENRAQMAAWGEFQRGVGRGARRVTGSPGNQRAVETVISDAHGGQVAYSDLVYFHVGGGIGLGIVANGQLYRGGSGYAGEFGHIVIDGSSPEKCGTCNQHGCLVTLVSGRSFVREYLKRTKGALSAVVQTEMNRPPKERAKLDAGYRQSVGEPGREDELEARAVVLAAEYDPHTRAPKDPDAHAVIQAAVAPLAKALSYIAYILDPEIVVLGGILTHSTILKRELTEAVPRELIWFTRDTQLKQSSLGDHADLVGAALWAKELHPSLVDAQTSSQPHGQL